MTDSKPPIRVRFAPSPTGSLHVGGARTALFCWLYARHHAGTFVLRIEDTDLERSSQASVEVILEGMAWLGLDADEGPFYQTQRMDRYAAVIQQLLDSGDAYRCYCSKERLEKLREQQSADKQKPRYDGRCRDLSTQDETQPHVVRFRTPQTGAVSFDDAVRGLITVNNAELDDLIIARTGGVPTYNLTVVVDDWDMQITDVIRGDDHINNTPRQINIFKALGADIPRYAHVPMILGSDAKRLSKRHGAVSLLQYKEAGILPQALRNYLIRLGWSHKDQEIFSLEEMIGYFNLDSMSRSPAIFDQDKLLWLNQHYLKTLPPETIVAPLTDIFERLNISLATGPALTDVIAIQAERVKDLVEMAERSRYFYEDDFEYDEKAARKQLKPEAAPVLAAVLAGLTALPAWEKQPLHQVVLDVAEQQQLKLGKVAQPIRVALTGGTVSPPIDATLHLLGRDRVLARLARAIAHINNLP